MTGYTLKILSPFYMLWHLWLDTPERFLSPFYMLWHLWLDAPERFYHHLILAYRWARPAILVAGRGVVFISSVSSLYHPPHTFTHKLCWLAALERFYHHFSCFGIYDLIHLKDFITILQRRQLLQISSCLLNAWNLSKTDAIIKGKHLRSKFF